MGDNGPKCTGPVTPEVREVASNARVCVVQGVQGCLRVPGQPGCVCELPTGWGGHLNLPENCRSQENLRIPTGCTECSAVHGGPQAGAGAIRGRRGHLLQRDLGAEESRVLLPGERPQWVGQHRCGRRRPLTWRQGHLMHKPNLPVASPGMVLTPTLAWRYREGKYCLGWKHAFRAPPTAPGC